MLKPPPGLWEKGMREEVPNTGESECSLDEQRLSMVLELYWRKAGGRREGKRERERLAMAKGYKGRKERQREKGSRERENKRKRRGE